MSPKTTLAMHWCDIL